MPFVVRLADATDAGKIVEYNFRLALETEDKHLDQAILASGVAAILADPSKGFYLVAGEAGDVLGQLAVTFEWSDWRNGWLWWIQSVYVRANARRRGVFRALYDEVYRLAREDGQVIGIRLYVEKENQAAQSTYATLGMSEAPYLIYERFPL